MILITTATQVEARPIIDFFRMKRIHKAPFSIYEGNQLFLIITTIGKLACISAVSYFFGKFGHNKVTGAINIGISGHKSKPIGDALLVHKIYDDDTTKTTYPSMAIRWKGNTDELTTFSKPHLDYSKNTLMDMEGAGFFYACLNFLNIDVIHSLKIISDNQDRPANFIDKDTVISLIKNHIPTLQKLIDSIFKINSALPEENQIEIDYITEKIHFTETEKVKLKELLERAVLLEVKYKKDKLIELNSAKKIINNLKVLIENGYNLH